MARDSLNIQGEVTSGQVSITPDEHDDARAARLKTQARRDLIDDIKEIAVFLVLLAAIIIMGAIATYEGFWDATVTADTKRWSQTILSALMAGGISFVVGRKIGK